MVRIFRPTKQIHFLVLIQRLNSNSLQILKNKEKSHQALASLCHPQSVLKPRQPCCWSELEMVQCMSQSCLSHFPNQEYQPKANSLLISSKFCLSSLFCSILLFLFCFLFGLSYCFLSRTRSPKKEEKRM